MGKAFATVIRKSKFYKFNGQLVKITHISNKNNRVILHNWETEVSEAIELDTAPNRLTPLFSIGEVGKMLDYAPATLRKYERMEILPTQKQYHIGRRSIRLYAEKDIIDISILLSQRPPVGRPMKINTVSKIDRKRVETGLKQRRKEVNKMRPKG